VAATLAMGIARVVLLVRVAVCAADARPRNTLPKFKLVGEIVRLAIPVPFKGMV
jgi:hypothetical protein